MNLRSLLPSVLCVTIFVSTAKPQAPLGAVVSGRFLVKYRAATAPTRLAERVQAIGGGPFLPDADRLGIALVQVAPADAARTRTRLTADPAVELVVEDRIVSADALHVRELPAAALSADALFHSPQGWAVRQVGGFGDNGTPGPWNTTTGAGVRIAILDSGVDANHPELAPNLVLNLSEIDQAPATGLPSPCDDGSPQDQQGHGTFSASLAAGAVGPNTGMVAGVAPSASILNIKVLERMPSAATSAADPTGCAAGQASGLLSWVLAGIDHALANHADIISMSLGTLVDITSGDGAGVKVMFDQVTHAAANAGAILIASAGNDGFDLSNQRYLELPAQARDVLAIVASTNPDCAENLAPSAPCVAGPVTLPYYSNFGAPLNALAAPGGSYPATDDVSLTSGWIWAACSNGIPSTLSGPPADSAHSFGCFNLGHAGYVQAMGTSAAAPLAAGAAALVLAAHPGWTGAQVVAALRASAEPLPGLNTHLVSAVPLVPPSTPQHGQHLDAVPQR